MKTILLTGRNGFVGQELAPLLKKNYKIISVIRDPRDHIDYSSEKILLKDCRRLELTDAKKHGIDLIIHLSAQVRGLTREKFNNNIESTKRISYISASLDIPVIFLSTTNVFFTESLGHYAKSKKICEEIIKSVNQKHLIIRVPLVIGRNSSSLKTVKDFYQKYSFFPLMGKQEGRTQPIPVPALTDCILNSLEDSRYDGREINLIGKQCYNYRNIVERTIGSAKGVKFVIVPFMIIYPFVKIFEIANIHFPLSCEEIKSVNTDKVLDGNKIPNTIVVMNDEHTLFSY